MRMGEELEIGQIVQVEQSASFPLYSNRNRGAKIWVELFPLSLSSHLPLGP